MFILQISASESQPTPSPEVPIPVAKLLPPLVEERPERLANNTTDNNQLHPSNRIIYAVRAIGRGFARLFEF